MTTSMISLMYKLNTIGSTANQGKQGNSLTGGQGALGGAGGTSSL